MLNIDVCVCVCARARACVRACVCACVRARARARVCVRVGLLNTRRGKLNKTSRLYISDQRWQGFTQLRKKKKKNPMERLMSDPRDLNKIELKPVVPLKFELFRKKKAVK